MLTEEKIRISLKWIQETKMKEEIKQKGKTDAWSRGFETALRMVLGE